MHKRTHSRRRTHPHRENPRTAAAALTLAALIVQSNQYLRADTHSWTFAGSDYWHNASCWNPPQVPAVGDKADVISSTSLTVSLDGLAPAYATPGLAQLRLDGIAGSIVTLNQTADSNPMCADAEIVGLDGTAQYLQYGGSNTVPYLYLGEHAQSAGTYLLSGSSSLWSDQQFIGGNGAGHLSHQDGTNSVRLLFVGASPGSSGTYALNGGTLTAGATEVGFGYGPGYEDGVGTFLHTGGLASMNQLSLGGTLFGIGYYQLGGAGSLVMHGPVEIGYAGRGRFTQTAGIHNIGSYLALGHNPGAIGVYNLSGSGVLSVGDVFVGGKDWEAGGAGVFNMSGGSATVAGTLKVLDTPWTAVNFSGGTLSIGALDTSGNPSRFNWTGGTLSVGSFWLYGDDPRSTVSSGKTLIVNDPGGLWIDNGSLSLSGTGHVIASGETIGFHYTSSVSQTGGTHEVGGILMAYRYDSKASYDLAGGTLSVPGGLTVGYDGVATFTQTGGTHTTGSIDLGYVDMYGSAGTYSLSGTGILHVTGGMYVGGSQIDPGGSGVFNLSGGTFSASGPTYVWNNGRINYNSGAFSTGTLALRGGGNVLLSPGNNKTLQTTSIIIDTDNGSQLNLADNRAIVDYTGASPINSIRHLLELGSAGGWTGNGITSSSAAGDSTKALGYGEASALSLSSFGGYGVDSTCVLIQYTWNGDANLDGQVDVTDLGALATNWQNTNAYWAAGDFNYDGFVNVTDLGLLATNWQAGVGDPLGPSLAQGLATLGLPGVTVPEPVSIAVLALFLPLMRRKRRSHSRTLHRPGRCY